MFKYEMHSHSSPCSGGGAPIEEHIDWLVKNGFSGMVITNHFFRGDNRVDRNLPWSEFVKAYEEDYERGKKYAKQYDFDLLFGIEEHIFGGKEVLIYGITPKVLYDHPELKYAGVEEYARIVHGAGGLIYQAHPYRSRAYITSVGPFDELDCLDGIEVYNAGNYPEDNEKAAVLAEEKGLKCIEGSDAHSGQSAGRAGIISRIRIRTNEQLVSVLKNGEYTLII